MLPHVAPESRPAARPRPVARPDRRTWPFLVVSHTLPVRRSRGGDGGPWTLSPGGLVSALAPIAREHGGAWIGWSGKSGPVPRPFVHSGITNAPVPLSPEEERGFYEGMCNTTLWPLYHDAVRQPTYRREWWASYVAANERFADAAASAAARGAVVWVQDYQLQLVPELLRRRRPDLAIGFFLHIPFPPDSLFRRLPWRRALVRGLLGADVVGFQTHGDRQHFAVAARRYGPATRTSEGLRFEGRSVRVDAFPISIDVARFAEAAKDPAVARRAEELRRRLGSGRKLILGVDRLDYTKGIERRLEAFMDLLRGWPMGDPRAIFVQVAVPSRERLGEYRILRRAVDEKVGQINGQFGSVGVVPVQYLRRTMPFRELVALYRAADVMLVTPFADGMNLVAKEFVASRAEDDGVLVLSEFAGAARELKSALLVNPHDVDGLAEAMNAALYMRPAEAARRMRALRRTVRRHTVHDWARSFLAALPRPDRG